MTDQAYTLMACGALAGFIFGCSLALALVWLFLRALPFALRTWKDSETTA